MQKIDSNIIDYTLKGERAAIGGYLPQYDEFAIGVYDAMITGDLEEIRVADMDKNVGKLDDIVYVTTHNVYAFQVKWSNVGDTMSYLDFKSLIPGIVDGWRKLKRLYPDKTIFPKLLTNKSLTNRDLSIKKLVREDGGFSEYEKRIIKKLNTGETIDTKWNNAVEELKMEAKLSEDEWNAFWRVFVFTFDYKQDKIEISNVEDQRTSDIIVINRLIQEMAARNVIQLNAHEIIVRLRWQNRFKTIFDHNLNVPEESYIPNSAGIKLLNDCLKGMQKGYIFLKGTPGSGKSTLLTQWTKNLINPSVRFYAFDFQNPSSQKNNDINRGSKMTFLNDIVILLHNAGIEKEQTLPPIQNETILKRKFYSQLNTISKQYEETGIPFIIVVDGLDHITREYCSCGENNYLMNILPSITDIPNGVIFVLGSQHYDHLGLNLTIEKEVKNNNNLIIMPPLSKEESDKLCYKILDQGFTSETILEKCWRKAQGHPLFLRYLLNQINIEGINTLDTIDDRPEEVEDYYIRIVGTLLENISIKKALGLLSRITGTIMLDDVRSLCMEDSISAIKNKMWHLFRYDKAGQTISFFHNSFRQYLLNKTAEDILTGDYSKVNDIEYFTKLSQHFEGKWGYGYYLYKAEKYDEFISKITPDYLYYQVQKYRPIWSVRRDLDMGIEIAKQKKDPYLLVRYLLFENQLSQMDNQECNVFSLLKGFIRSGQGTLAKAIIREGRLLHCPQEYALDFAIEFLRTEDKEEANLLFDLSYPDFLFHGHTLYRNEYQNLKQKNDILKKWVKTAGYFLDWPNIEKKVSTFIAYLQSSDTYDDNDRFDANTYELEFVNEYLESLIDQSRWDDFKSVTKLFFYKDKYRKVLFSAYDAAIIHLSQRNANDELLKEYFANAEKIFGSFETRSVGNLRMTFLAYLAEQSNDVIESYIKNVNWTELGSFYQDETLQNFNTLSSFIFYIKIKTMLGICEDIKTLVPDDYENDLMVCYARQIFTIAKMVGTAMSGSKDLSFIPHITFCISYYDSIERPVSYNKYSYTLSRQRADFYKYAVESAQYIGEDVLNKVAEIFASYFDSVSCKADSKSQRTTILAFYRIGFNKKWCIEQLLKLETKMLEGKDVDGIVQECFEQGQTWLEIGYPEKAEHLFHIMIEESFGIGYRKDYQPSLFAEWLGEAIKNEPENAIKYVHWLTSRFKHIETVAESNTRLKAAEKLLKHTCSYNLKSGLKLAIWLLDNEYDYFQSVSSALLCELLQNTSTAIEYRSLFRYYTELHLYIDETANNNLLKEVILCGQKILGDNFSQYESLLRIKISTECQENIQEELTKEIDKIQNMDSHHNDVEQNIEHEQNIIDAQVLLQQGKKDEAWEMAISALNESKPTGWIRYYDGGTRINACKMLQTIDEERGRDITIELFAQDIAKGISYGAMQYLDEILPLLTKQVDFKRLFKEEFAYMNQILRTNTCCETDNPNIDPDESTTFEVLRDWLLWLAKSPIICISERAKILLAHLINDSNVSFLEILPNNSYSERLLLEIGNYLVELESIRLTEFKLIAKKAAVSDNYQYRVYANKILTKLKEQIPIPRHKTLPVTYFMYFTESNVKTLFKFSDNRKNNIAINWNDVDSIMNVASYWCNYLSYCTGITNRTINYRAVELMRKIGNISEVNNNIDNTINHHYNAINLCFPYRKTHAQAALDGMLMVAAELNDGGAVHGQYQDNIFKQQDFGNINIEPCRKPDFIQRIAPPKVWSVDEKWIDNYEESPRLCDGLPEYNGQIVIGEYTILKKTADDIPIENYQSKISFINTNKDYSTNNFFGDSPCMHESSEYLQMGDKDPELIMLRRGYYTDCTNKSKWIAFNPSFARSCGWKPCSKKYFSWQNDIGDTMVESLFWRSGNIDSFSRGNNEVSEGWIVIASKQAIEELRKISPLYVHKMLTRSIGDNLLDTSHSAYRIFHYT